MKIIKYDIIYALIIGVGAGAAFYGTCVFEGILSYGCGFLFGLLASFLTIWSFEVMVDFFENKEPQPTQVWKEVKRETLGKFTDYGERIQDITTMYRIAIHEECLLTKEKRIREVQSLWPSK